MYENDIYSNYETYNTNSNTGTGTGPETGGAGDGGKGTGKKKKMGTFRKILLSMSLGLVFGLFAGAGFYAVQLGTGQLVSKEEQETGDQEGTGTEDDSVRPVSTLGANQVTYIHDDVSDMVERVMPAMVSVINNYTQTISSFWGQTYTQPGTGAGSGIIVAENDTELLIVTNNHVVESANELQVNFIDGTTAPASIKGTDADMDLAVIAVKLEDLSQETRDAIVIATLGDSSQLKLGMPVIAIGNALGYGQSVTGGYISALDREVTMEDGSVGVFLQTDAAINSGNSGGALLTITGEVIGINSSKIRGTGVEGMGYAIPISAASPIIADLMQRETRTELVEEDEMGYLGITMQNVTDQVTQMLGLPQGVYIYEIEEDGPARKAGMWKGDIIVKFDGRRISSNTDMKEIMPYYRAGETVTITVKRFEEGEYKTLDLEVELGSWPEGRTK